MIRVLRMILAYFLASCAAGISISFLWSVAQRGMDFAPNGIAHYLGITVLLIPFVTLFTFAVALLPWLVLVTVAEATKRRTPLFFAFAGALNGLFCTAILMRNEPVSIFVVFTFSGVVAGLTYWRIMRNAPSYRYIGTIWSPEMREAFSDAMTPQRPDKSRIDQ